MLVHNPNVSNRLLNAYLALKKWSAQENLELVCLSYFNSFKIQSFFFLFLLQAAFLVYLFVFLETVFYISQSLFIVFSFFAFSVCLLHLSRPFFSSSASHRLFYVFFFLIFMLIYLALYIQLQLRVFFTASSHIEVFLTHYPLRRSLSRHIHLSLSIIFTHHFQ